MPKSVFADNTMIIKGSNLMGASTYLKIGAVDFQLSISDNDRFISKTEIKFKLDPDKPDFNDLKIGIQSLSIVHPLLLGKPLVRT
ncbi:MAG: hypothetical protein IPJ43_02525 [Saprospiraceae bacterium]|nr:hypothetical protein [Saprospiraceae bacterium]